MADEIYLPIIQPTIPETQSIGPRTPEGQATVAMNAWRGGHREMLRELSRLVSAEVREARDLVERVSRQ